MKPDDPINLMRRMGLEPDGWQCEILSSRHPRILLNGSRQSGKSTTVASLALSEAIFNAGTQVLLVSRSFRQAAELFRKITDFHWRIGEFLKVRRNAQELLLKGNSRIVCLPCREETIRGYSGIDLLLLDEAARIPDDLYRAVRPMLAVSGGRMIGLSTPYGKRGWFWDAWAHGGDDWFRIQVSADQLARITPAFLASERRALGESWFRQEYCCSFEALEGLVYPNLARCIAHGNIPLGDRWVGGIDFGYRNPFAAIWGYVTGDGVLVLVGEHYSREKPLSYHMQFLPRHVTWYADPSGATERAELRRASYTVREAKNTLRPGIAAVNARIQNGTLLIREGSCPNLLAEAALYRYSDHPAERHAEIPVDEHNHALSALRYLIMMIGAQRPTPGLADKAKPPLSSPPRSGSGWGAPPNPWLTVRNEELWTPLE